MKNGLEIKEEIIVESIETKQQYDIRVEKLKKEIQEREDKNRKIELRATLLTLLQEELLLDEKLVKEYNNLTNYYKTF